MQKVSLKSLNKQQRDAVTAPLKPILVVAGAGTGKTTVLIKRFEYLVKEKNIPPEEIILVTFTNKAINEIKQRLLDLFGESEEFFQKINVSTFHKFCRNILEREGRMFNVCNEKRAAGYIRQIISDLGLGIRANYEMAELIRRVKWFQYVENKVITVDDLIRAGRHCTQLSEEAIIKKYPFDIFKAVWAEYDNTLKRYNRLSHDDCQFEVDKLLDNELTRLKWEGKIQAILFDEFQDIDPIQLRIIVKLSKTRRNIFCVGDPDQAIYAFRNALPKSFYDFQKLFSDAKIFKLEINYRSTQPILVVANKLINRKKTAFSKKLVSVSKNSKGKPVELFVTNDPKKEIEKIIDTIVKIRKRKPISFKNFCVLFRNWVFGRDLSRELARRGIPFFSEDLENFWNKEEIKDTLAYLDLAFKKDNKITDNSLLRIINRPSRGLGPKALQKLRSEARYLGVSLLVHVTSNEKIKSDFNCRKFFEVLRSIRQIASGKEGLCRKISDILNESGLKNYYEKIDRQKWQNIGLFLIFVSELEAGDYEETLKRLEEFTKFTTDRDAVYLSTVHSAKGLEFDYVFVMHMEEGKLPSKYSLEDVKKIDEERRIAYVAFTRAKKMLFLLSSAGEEKVSRFIKNIESKLSKTVDISKDYVEKDDKSEFYNWDVDSNFGDD